MSKHEAEQLIKQLRTYQKRVTSNRRAAMAALKRAGLINKHGRATKYYAQDRNSRLSSEG